MRILILANYDLGLYQFRKELIKELLKENEVYISLPYGELIEPLKEMGCHFVETEIDRRGINPIKDLRLLIHYKKIIKSIKPQLVITYTIKPNVYGGLICRLYNINYAINITGLGSSFEKNGLLKYLVCTLNRISCKNAKVVFFENEANMNFFIENKIVSPEIAYRLNGAGVNLNHFTIKKYPKGDDVHFLFMGRIMKEKGVNELFKAMKLLKENGFKVYLDVIGSLEENYKNIIQEYEKEGWLKYYGFQKNVKPYIEKAHCFVLPSWHEGMANTNLESAACARPVITSNIPGCREAVEDKVSGFLVEKQNYKELYECMKHFISLTYNERKQMGLAGRKRMEQQFDKKIIVRQTIERLKK